MFATEGVKTCDDGCGFGTAVQGETVQAQMAARMAAMEVQAGMTERAQNERRFFPVSLVF